MAPSDAAGDGVLQPGESGPAVQSLQERLAALGYWSGTPDGQYGDLTRQAVLAFQKAEGLGRDGIAGPETRGRLPAAQRPAARSTSGNLIEIDLARQLLLVVQNGQVRWAFNTSTGTASTPTPTGQFGIQREIDGYRHAELGVLYRPKYFVGGVAIHGYPSVPAYPASHACTRVSNPAMDLLWSSGVAAIGTPVWVY
jgi:peptidoglycan hydrolase-like protein with peptidoglycan-binding domain